MEQTWYLLKRIVHQDTDIALGLWYILLLILQLFTTSNPVSIFSKKIYKFANPTESMDGEETDTFGITPDILLFDIFLFFQLFTPFLDEMRICIIFQGGVSANRGLLSREFEQILEGFEPATFTSEIHNLIRLTIVGIRVTYYCSTREIPVLYWVLAYNLDAVLTSWINAGRNFLWEIS